MEGSLLVLPETQVEARANFSDSLWIESEHLLPLLCLGDLTALTRPHTMIYKSLVFLAAIGSAVGQGDSTTGPPPGDGGQGGGGGQEDGGADLVDPRCDDNEDKAACEGAAACFWTTDHGGEGFCAANCDSRPEVVCESHECAWMGPGPNQQCKKSCAARFATQETCDTEGTDCMWYVHHPRFQWCEAACSATPAGADCPDHFCERGESGACEKRCRAKYPNLGLNDGSACDADPK